MSQEAVERRSLEENKNSGRVINLEQAAKIIQNSTMLLTPQKEALIRQLSQIPCEIKELEKVSELREKIDAYGSFCSRIRKVLDDGKIQCENSDYKNAIEVVDQAFRNLLGISLDGLSPFERGEIERISKDFFVGEHYVDVSPIQDSLKELEEDLMQIGEERKTSVTT